MKRWPKQNLRWLRLAPIAFGVLTAAVLIVVTQRPRAVSSSPKDQTVSLPAITNEAADTDQANLPLWQITEPIMPKSPPPARADCAIVTCVALTFDDGPDSAVTPAILSLLDREQIKATFFVIGLKVSSHQELLRRMKDDGQEIGNHTWAHPDLTKLRPDQIREQVDKTQAALISAGVGPATLFRAPYGYSNPKVREIVGMPFIFWNVDPRDWKDSNPASMAATVRNTVKPGSIIILHDTKANTPQAAELIIHDLKAAHYQFVTVSSLIQPPPGSHDAYMGRP